MTATCGCAEIGPLLVGPGTSGRDWTCGTCGRVWTAADVAAPATRRVLVVDLEGGAGPFVDDLVTDVRRTGTVLLFVDAVSGRQLCLDARVADAAIGEPETVDGSPRRPSDPLVRRAVDVLELIGAQDLADAVRRRTR